MRKRQEILQYSADKGVGSLADPRLLITLIILGFALRIAIAVTSVGSNDASSFAWFGGHIRFQGLTAAYAQDADLNHPPIPGLWAALVWCIGERFHDPITPFFALFKLPVIAADALAAYLLYKIGVHRGGRSSGLALASCFAWALCPILVSAYHGNTDSIYAALSLLAVYLLADRRKAGLAGLALGAAINIKLIPCLLIPGMLVCLQRRREVILFLGGLALGVLPFIPLLIAIGPEFSRNALGYSPHAERWGLMLPLTWDRPYPPALPDDRWLLAYNQYGRYIILALAAVWTALAWRLKRWDAYEIAAGTYAIFLIFAPGFGVQYTAIIAPLLFVAAVRVANIYCLIAGFFLMAAYWVFWDGNFPFGSEFRGYLPLESAGAGFIAWAILVYFLGVLLWKIRSPVKV